MYYIVLYLTPVLNPKSYDGARVLEASGRPMLVIGNDGNDGAAGTKTTGTKGARKTGEITGILGVDDIDETNLTGTKEATAAGITGVTGLRKFVSLTLSQLDKNSCTSQRNSPSILLPPLSPSLFSTPT